MKTAKRHLDSVIHRQEGFRIVKFLFFIDFRVFFVFETLYKMAIVLLLRKFRELFIL